MRREATIYIFVKQIPSENGKYYGKYNRDSDTYYIGIEDKNIIVIDSSNEENKREV